jgi:hypothetical protein
MQTGFEFSDLNILSYRFKKAKTLTGKDWIREFCRILGPAVSSPEQCSMGRIFGFNRM